MDRQACCAGALMISLTLLGCGANDHDVRIDGAPGTSSALILGSAPVCTLTGVYGDAAFFVDAGSATISFIGEAGADLTVPGATILCAAEDELGGTEYLLAGSVDTSDIFTMYRFADSDGDGLPDQSTRTALYTSVGALYGSVVSRANDAYHVLLDARCQDLLLAKDTDSDGWPDTLLGTRFAKSDDHPLLLDARDIIAYDDAGDLTVAIGPLPFYYGGGSVAEGSAVTAKYSDTDGDEIADVETQANPADSTPSHHGVYPHDGQGSIEVSSEMGLVSKTIEVWKLDSNHDDVALLGSVTLADETKGTVTLGFALVAGDLIGIRYVGEASSQSVVEVADDWPQVHSSDVSGALPYTLAQTITVTGVNFDPNMTIVLTEDPQTETNLSYTYLSSTEIQVTIPALSGWPIVWLHALGQGQDQEEPVTQLSFEVAEP